MICVLSSRRLEEALAFLQKKSSINENIALSTDVDNDKVPTEVITEGSFGEKSDLNITPLQQAKRDHSLIEEWELFGNEDDATNDEAVLGNYMESFYSIGEEVTEAIRIQNDEDLCLTASWFL